MCQLGRKNKKLLLPHVFEAGYRFSIWRRPIDFLLADTDRLGTLLRFLKFFMRSVIPNWYLVHYKSKAFTSFPFILSTASKRVASMPPHFFAPSPTSDMTLEFEKDLGSVKLEFIILGPLMVKTAELVLVIKRLLWDSNDILYFVRRLKTVISAEVWTPYSSGIGWSRCFRVLELICI